MWLNLNFKNVISRNVHGRYIKDDLLFFWNLTLTVCLLFAFSKSSYPLFGDAGWVWLSVDDFKAPNVCLDTSSVKTWGPIFLVYRKRNEGSETRRPTSRQSARQGTGILLLLWLLWQGIWSLEGYKLAHRGISRAPEQLLERPGSPRSQQEM